MSKWQSLLQQTAGRPLIAGLIARAGRIERVTLSSVVLAATLLRLFARLGNAVGRGTPAFVGLPQPRSSNLSAAMARAWADAFGSLMNPASAARAWRVQVRWQPRTRRRRVCCERPLRLPLPGVSRCPSVARSANCFLFSRRSSVELQLVDCRTVVNRASTLPSSFPLEPPVVHVGRGCSTGQRDELAIWRHD